MIAGGGVMGSATACFLARDHGAQVTVVERDPTWTRASSALSASSIRQQFGTAVNIALSTWSVQFLRRVEDELGLPGAPAGIGLVEPGYLYLATPEGEAAMRKVHAVQSARGADVALLGPEALRTRYSWLQVDDIALGSLGLSGEGWFDGPALHQAFRRRAQVAGVRFVAAEATGFDTVGDRVTSLRCADGSVLAADAFVLCAGAWSAPLAAALGVDLPVRARKRDVFVLDSPARLPGCPLLIDPSGVWCRPEGRGFIAGAPPGTVEAGGPGDPDEPPLHAIDHTLFDEVIWPALAARVPAFEALRVRSAWAGYYEMNLFDHNGLAGALPGWRNAWTACGFSGHGMQQSPAVGCALAAAMAQAPNPAPSLEALSPARVAEGRPLLEPQVI